jgi:hypothetical protein
MSNRKKKTPSRDTLPVYKNILSLTEYLQSEGYKVSKTKVYNDRDSGLLEVQDDGSILFEDAQLYMEFLEKSHIENYQLSEIMQQIKEKELKLLEIKILKAQFENEQMQKKYMLRSDFGRELAAQAIILDNGLRSFIRRCALETIRICKGDESTEDALLENWNKMLDEQMNEFCTTKQYHITFTE